MHIQNGVPFWYQTVLMKERGVDFPLSSKNRELCKLFLDVQIITVVVMLANKVASEDGIEKYHTIETAKEFFAQTIFILGAPFESCLLYTSPSPRDRQKSRMPSSA